MIQPIIPNEKVMYIGVETATAGAGLKLQTATTPGTKEKVVRIAEIRPIASVVLFTYCNPTIISPIF